MAKKKRKPLANLAVIEESEDNIYSIKFVLQSLRYEVSSFAAHADYLARISDVDPALVMVDMLIPNGDGFEIVHRIRETFPKLPVVAITADAMKGGDEEDARKAGASAILSKPYTVTDLQGILDDLVPSPSDKGD